MKALICRFGSDRAGATAIEYGLIASLIALAIVTSAQSVGTALVAVFQLIGAAL